MNAMLNRLREYFFPQDPNWIVNSTFVSFTVRRGIVAVGSFVAVMFTLLLWWWGFDITAYSLLKLVLISYVTGGLWGASAWLLLKFTTRRRR